MEAPENIESKPAKTEYRTWQVLLLVLLWLAGFGVMLAFGFATLLTFSMQSWPLGLWNLLVTLAELWALLYSVRLYSRRTAAASEAMLWAVVAAVGVPLVASGGCALLADTLRIGG